MLKSTGWLLKLKTVSRETRNDSGLQLEGRWVNSNLFLFVHTSAQTSLGKFWPSCFGFSDKLSHATVVHSVGVGKTRKCFESHLHDRFTVCVTRSLSRIEAVNRRTFYVRRPRVTDVEVWTWLNLFCFFDVIVLVSKGSKQRLSHGLSVFRHWC